MGMVLALARWRGLWQGSFIMDELPPTPESAGAPPGSSPPTSPLTPPPVIRKPSLPPPLTMAAARPRSSVIWKILTVVFLALFVLSFLLNFAGFSQNVIPHSRATMDRVRNLEEVTLSSTNSDNKIAVIEVDGVISSGEIDRSGVGMVQYIKDQLKMAERDTDVKAVILKVNSPGGEVLASDEINKAITKFQDQTHRPVVASMGALAASGGYYISVPCQWIVANELTITGSIGVIMHGYNYRELMDKVGIHPQVFKSGRFKDMLSGEREDKNLTAEEQRTRDQEDQMVQSLINETFNKFKEVVKTGRGRAARENAGDGKTLVDEWEDYADGRVLSGKQALNFGFVDELGDFDAAIKRAETLAKISRANLVQYRMPMDLGSLLSRILGKTEMPAIKVDLGVELPKLEAGRLYFIAPMTVLH
jgi:protease-4